VNAASELLRILVCPHERGRETKLGGKRKKKNTRRRSGGRGWAKNRIFNRLLESIKNGGRGRKEIGSKWGKRRIPKRIVQKRTGRRARGPGTEHKKLFLRNLNSSA